MWTRKEGLKRGDHENVYSIFGSMLTLILSFSIQIIISSLFTLIMIILSFTFSPWPSFASLHQFPFFFNDRENLPSSSFFAVFITVFSILSLAYSVWPLIIINILITNHSIRLFFSIICTAIMINHKNNEILAGVSLSHSFIIINLIMSRLLQWWWWSFMSWRCLNNVHVLDDPLNKIWTAKTWKIAQKS